MSGPPPVVRALTTLKLLHLAAHFALGVRGRVRVVVGGAQRAVLVSPPAPPAQRLVDARRHRLGGVVELICAVPASQLTGEGGTRATAAAAATSAAKRARVAGQVTGGQVSRLGRLQDDGGRWGSALRTCQTREHSYNVCCGEGSGTGYLWCRDGVGIARHGSKMGIYWRINAELIRLVDRFF